MLRQSIEAYLVAHHACLAILGAACGTGGSIVTAFSVNRVLQTLSENDQFLNATVEALVTQQSNVPIFNGTNARFNRAQRGSASIVWFGVVLLCLGFILQAVSIVL